MFRKLELRTYGFECDCVACGDATDPQSFAAKSRERRWRLREISDRIYFDDMEKPIMLAEDKTFAAGHIGFGSFDDTGRVRNIRIRGPKAEDKRADFFKPLGKESKEK